MRTGGWMLRRKCRGTVVFDVTGNSWWKETKMWLDYMISSSKCRYLIFFTSPLPLIHSLSIAIMNAWLWRKAEISPGWKPLSDLVFVLTCCTHLRLLLCGHSLTLSLFLSVSQLHALKYTHFSILAVSHSASPSIAFCLEDTAPPPYFFYSMHPSTVLRSLSDCSFFSSPGFEHPPLICCHGFSLFCFFPPQLLF